MKTIILFIVISLMSLSAFAGKFDNIMEAMVTAQIFTGINNRARADAITQVCYQKLNLFLAGFENPVPTVKLLRNADSAYYNTARDRLVTLGNGNVDNAIYNLSEGVKIRALMDGPISASQLQAVRVNHAVSCFEAAKVYIK